MLLNEFKNINYVGDHQIDKEKEKELIAAMYDGRQKMTEIQEMNQVSGDLIEMLSEENLKLGIELQNKLYDNYIESARTILSDSQIENFSSFIASKKSLLEMSSKLIGVSEQEKDK